MFTSLLWSSSPRFVMKASASNGVGGMMQKPLILFAKAPPDARTNSKKRQIGQSLFSTRANIRFSALLKVVFSLAPRPAPHRNASRRHFTRLFGRYSRRMQPFCWIAPQVSPVDDPCNNSDIFFSHLLSFGAALSIFALLPIAVPFFPSLLRFYFLAVLRLRQQVAFLPFRAEIDDRFLFLPAL